MTTEKSLIIKPFWLKMSQLAPYYGMTAVEFGSTLKRMGWRNADGTPSVEAMEEEVAKTIEYQEGSFLTLWDRNKIFILFEDAGFDRLSEDQVREIPAKRVFMNVFQISDNYKLPLFQVNKKLILEGYSDIKGVPTDKSKKLKITQEKVSHAGNVYYKWDVTTLEKLGFFKK